MSTRTPDTMLQELHRQLAAAPAVPVTNELDLRDLLHTADDVAFLVADADLDMYTTSPLWRAGHEVTESFHPDTVDDTRRLGSILTLAAILERPGILEQAVRILRAKLSAGLPINWPDQLVTVKDSVLTEIEHQFRVRRLSKQRTKRVYRARRRQR